MVLQFGPFELDLATCELRRDGRAVPLQPRVFGILRYLVEHRDRVVAKQELLDVLWGGRQLNAVAVPWAINRARRALEQDSDGNAFIQTVRGHGYRFVGELRAAAANGPESAQVAPHSQPPDAVKSTQEPFVGRELLMARLSSALDAASEGLGGLYLLTGEPGIGKTRCVSEFALLARRRGLRVWTGRSFESLVAPAFWPFIQILRAACGDASLHEASRREAEKLLALLAPDDIETTRVQQDYTSTGDVRFWLLDRLSSWLCSSGRAQVRVVVLDDVHCADESSLRALALLAPQLSQTRLVVVATARDGASSADGVGNAVNPEPALATRLKSCEHVPLAGLELHDVHAYLTQALDPGAAAQLGPALHHRTGGNPLFVREIARMLRVHHAQGRDAESAVTKLPPAVQDVIQARLQALDDRSRLVLEAASVIGEEFALPILQRTLNVEAQQLLANLHAAVLANIVEPRPASGKYAFVHSLMREVLYMALPTAQRANLHAAVGSAFESLALVEPHVNELAYHFHLAPVEPYPERALRYSRRAGDAAMRSLAYDEAARFYDWALEAQPLVDPGDAAAACELLICSAGALQLAGRSAQARARCERAVELAREAKLPDLLVRAVGTLRPTVWFAQVPDPLLVGALQDALALLPKTALAARSRVYSQLASLPPCSLRMELGRQMSEQAVSLARSVHEPPLLLEALRSSLYSLSGPDSIDELLRVTDEIVALDGPTQGSTRGADAHLARFQALLRSGDRAGAERALDAFERITRKLRMRPATWHADRLRAQLLLHAGKLDEAEQRFHALWEEAQHMREPVALICYRAQMYALNLERTGKRLSTSFQQSPDETSWAKNLPGFRAQLLWFAIETGDLARAKRELHVLAERRFEAVVADCHGLFALALLASATAFLGEREVAATLRAQLEPYAQLNALSPLSMSVGCVARYLAELERLLGEDARAREHYKLAIAVNARTGHELERLRSCLGLAELLGQRGTGPERLRARTMAAEVQGTAERFGAYALCASARELGERLGVNASVPRPAKTKRRAH